MDKRGLYRPPMFKGGSPSTANNDESSARRNFISIPCSGQRSHIIGFNIRKKQEAVTNTFRNQGIGSPGKQLPGSRKISVGPNLHNQAPPMLLSKIPDNLREIPKVVSADPLEPEASKHVWELHTDGAATKEGTCMGLIHNNPRGDENNIRCNILMSGLVYAAVGAARQGIYSTEQFTLGSPDPVCEEEGWVAPDVYRLPRAE
uniref:Uncharacterized protein n=1 Tax=Lactuca sativa TaxID=4236 RepID=A0A9R1XU78_LACSA|nr:hypothetical protein LSAT_V11C100025120 [Lactuca sativa]